MYKHMIILQKNAASQLLTEIASAPTSVFAAALLTIGSAAEALEILDTLVWEQVVLAASDTDCSVALEIAAVLPTRISALLLLNPQRPSLPDAFEIPTLLVTTDGQEFPAPSSHEHFCLHDNPSAHLSEIISAFLTLRVA
ncbi:hypothetical protein CIG75_14025 [Tumebacillus algifaecis]|uniref:Uncharacterized protein n=1 Tax=Tumebacillus algifaecis TaxID=1214604 RepID=A0A223D3J5_9BACL|nr:hypothetical protein [Tumebacillus algifaecis]ASS75966.1 hypothetical protein CIG75_14025 [Tumebacillus algifaecis]